MGVYVFFHYSNFFLIFLTIESFSMPSIELSSSSKAFVLSCISSSEINKEAIKNTRLKAKNTSEVTAFSR